MNKTIFYFSATGNSLYTAHQIANVLRNTDVVSIAKAGMNYTCNSEIIGLIFPVYAWGLPNIVHEFIKSGSFNKNAYFFSVVTCGGAIGNCLADVNTLLKKKGAYLHYGAKLAFLSNYIFMVDIKTDKVPDRLSKADKNLDAIINDIISRKECKIKSASRLFESLNKRSSENRKSTDKDFSVSESCTKCGICVSVCPVKNIEITQGNVTFKHQCESCLACMHWCPQKAINYKDKTQHKQRYHHPKIKLSQIQHP